MRAILLAKRDHHQHARLAASMRASQEPAGAPLRMARRTAALAPMISSRRRVRSPILDVAPSFCLPPVECCSGVRPSQAAKSRPRLKVCSGGASAAIAVAMIGPCRGWSSVAWLLVSSLARRAISTVQQASSSDPASAAAPRARKGSSAPLREQFGLWDPRLPRSACHMGRALRDDQAKFGKMATQGVDDLGPLTHQQIAGTKYNGRSLCAAALFTATNRIVGRCAASQIASASAASFFCRFTNGLT